MRSPREAVAFGGLGRKQSAGDDGIQGNGARIFGLGQPVILVHHTREQSAIERAPIHADANRLAKFDSGFDHGAEIVVVLFADVDVAGIDAVFGQRARARRIFLQQKMAVVMEIADDRNAHTEHIERVHDLRNRSGSSIGVDGNADEFRSRARQRHDLIHRGGDVGGIGVCHRLHDDRVSAAHLDTTDIDRY